MFTALQLENVSGLRLGSALLIPDMIEMLAKRPESLVPLGIGSNGVEDFMVMSYIVAQKLPLKIRTDIPDVLLCQLARFPYEIDGEPGYEEFAMRLFPQSGKIMSVAFLAGAESELNLIEATPEKLFLELSKIRHEIYFSTKDVRSLPAMKPVFGFNSQNTTNRT